LFPAAQTSVPQILHRCFGEGELSRSFSTFFGRAAQRAWRLCGKAATRLILPSLAVSYAAQPAEARWLRAESPLFTIYSEGKESELREYTRRLEEYDGLLRNMTGTTRPPSPNKLIIYLVKDNDQLRKVTPRVSQDVQGLYLAQSSGTIATAVRKDIGGRNWLSAQSIMFHEYTHHFVYQYFPANYPSWTSEGIAEYFSGVDFQKDQIEVGHFQNARVYPLRTRAWMPVERLFQPKRGTGGSGMFYPQAWLVTHYMMDDETRQKKLNDYLLAIGKGENNAKAFQDAFGMDYAAFDQVMKAYLAKGEVLIRKFKRNPVAPEIAITALPDSADKLLLAHAQYIADSLSEQDEADVYFGRKDLAKIRKAAAKFPDDALAQRTLAAGEMLYGDLNATDALIEKVLAKNPDDIDALYIKAARYVVEGRRHPAQRAALFAQAKPIAGEVYRRNPNHYPSLYIYALGALANAEDPSENTLNVLKLAHQLAPQVEEISLEAAVALSNAGAATDARRLLELVAYGPHSSSRSRYARALLNQVEKGSEIKHVPGELPYIEVPEPDLHDD